MKTSSIKLVVAACGLALAGQRSGAQDAPTPAPQPRPEPSAEQRNDSPDKQRPQRNDPPRGQDFNRNRGGGGGGEMRGPKPEMKLTPYIGVFTRPLSDEVRAQTGLAEGFGLIVEDVMPDSPAQAAGLVQHDILVLLGDQKLVNQDQLSVLVRAEKKDAEIVFTLRRAGAEQKATVKVGEKMMPVALDRDSSRPGVLEPFRNFFNGRDSERLSQQLREQTEKFNEHIKEFGDRVQDWARRPGGPQPQHRRDGDHGPGPDANKDNPGRRPQGRPPGDEEPRRDFKSSSSSSTSFQRNVVRRDESGEYVLSENNGAKVLTVKPVSGEEQTFIVNTEEQRKAVPEAYRAKLRELENVDGKIKEGDAPPAQQAPGETKPGS